MRRLAVLVTDGEQRSALAVVRSLGRAGHDVHVASATGASIAGASRWASSETRAADPLADPVAFLRDVGRIAGERSAEVVVPLTEAAILALHRAPDRVPAPLLTPPAATFESIRNKATVLGVARELGIAVPQQAVLTSRRDLRGEWAALSPPFVVKPAHTVGGEAGRWLRLPVRYAADAAELTRIVAGIPQEGFPVLVQERVIGPGEGVFLLMRDRAVRAVFCHRRVREKPPSGGVSVCCESVAADPDLVRQAVSLLQAFDWEGVAMVEFKRDRRTGVPFLMEVNGRFWGSLQLAIDAGVDFPRLAVAHFTGESLPTQPGYRTGVRSRWLWGEVDHTLAVLRSPASDLALPPGAPGRMRTVLSVLRFRPGRDRFDVLRASDPRPFLRESRAWLRASFGRDRRPAQGRPPSGTPLA
jgi:predicted ATP-grasp superfamily ATP-dependent carboligase